MVACDERLVHAPFVLSESWSPCAPLVRNQGFTAPLGGPFVSTNPVKVPDIRFSSSKFCNQHRHEKTGCKLNDVTVVYTKWENLKKTNDMDVGQVAFHNNKAVQKIVVEKRNGDVIKRLNKTKEQCQHPDLRGEREKRDIRIKNKEKAVLAAKKKSELEAQKVRAAEAEKRSYDRLFVESKMRTNEDGYDSDDFM
ncbi:unnamed protein product [Schistosoma margrebowiei]|uniref:Uncharacterized protein n=1 Tax=Schistosoma margrebowiei TaxID=48269 RepID=A0A183LJR1_9TREM|nr:unnamed protein product [Schistosoma margrebowiei]